MKHILEGRREHSSGQYSDSRPKSDRIDEYDQDHDEGTGIYILTKVIHRSYPGNLTDSNNGPEWMLTLFESLGHTMSFSVGYIPFDRVFVPSIRLKG